MSMTLQQAISALSNPEYQTIAGLRSLVSQVSVAVPNVSNGATTLLYSGMIGNLPAWQIAEEIGSSSDGRVITIGETPVAKLLGSNEFKDALEQAAGTNDTAVIKSLLDGTANPDGTRTEGMWDIASRNLAQAASGDVRTLTPFSDAGKVFAQTELPVLLDNPNVTHIDGIPKEDLLRLHSDALTQGLSERRRWTGCAPRSRPLRLKMPPNCTSRSMRTATSCATPPTDSKPSAPMKNGDWLHESRGNATQESDTVKKYKSLEKGTKHHGIH